MRNRVSRDLQAEIWTTNSGQKIKIADMDTKHINNSIDMLKREMPRYSRRGKEEASSYIDLFVKELILRERKL